MTRWLLAWELGHGLGHLAGLTAVARQALRHGIEPVIASSKPLPDSVALPTGTRFLLAPPLPLPPPYAAQATGTSSMTELLFEQGCSNVNVLAARVLGWRDLIEIVSPSALIADHAPTALLTARSIGIPVVQLGTGFAIPPTDGSGALPSFRTWETPNAERMAQAESAVAQALQQAARVTGLPLAASAAELYSAPAVLRSVPLLDHYPRALREASSAVARYCGPLELARPSGHAALPAWPGNPGASSTRILAYLKAAHPLTVPLLNTLALLKGSAEISALVYVDGAEGIGNPHANIHIQNTPLPFKAMLDGGDNAPGAQLVIHQGGIGASSQALLAGVPQLLLPDMAEAFITARTLVGEGAAELLRPEATRQLLQQTLLAMIVERRYGESAANLARENSAFASDNEALMWRLVNEGLAESIG